MSEDRAFVYAVCGAASHIKTLYRSLEYLLPRTKLPVYVVTDSRRNEIPVDHAGIRIIDIESPAGFNNHQASIYLKTALHRWTPAGPRYAYLDSDVLAVDEHPDRIFEHASGPVTFARDLTCIGEDVGLFSPWAVNCSCPAEEGRRCNHLAEAIERKFGVSVASDWLHWNGGVFLFSPASTSFLDTWHSFTMRIFEDSAWKTRDQGTLIATVWKLKLERQACLPPGFNFIVDRNNPNLRFRRDAGYTLFPPLPPIRPSFLHLYHEDLDNDGWSLEAFETSLERKNGGMPAARALGFDADSVPRASRAKASWSPAKVIVGRPQWTDTEESRFCEVLVRGLLKRGVDAHVLVTEERFDRFASPEPPMPYPDDVPVESLPAPRDGSWGTRWGTLVRYLEERSPCVFVPVGDFRNAIVSAHLSDRVVIIGAMDNDPRSADEVHRLGRFWNAIVTPTWELALRLSRSYPEWAERIFRIAPGVEIRPADDVRDEKEENSPLRLLYHGYLSHRRKRVLDLPLIVEELVGRGVPVKLSIGGHGPDLEALVERFAGLLGAGTVRFTGNRTPVELVRDLGQHDVWLTVGESLRGSIEALEAGCIPVVGDTPGAGEFVLNGINGYRVALGDIEGFADRIEALYRDPELCRQLSGSGRRSVRSLGLDAEDMVGEFLDLLPRAAAFRRTAGFLAPPPHQVAGEEVFPVRYVRGVGSVGLFPSYREDYDDYRNAAGPATARQFPEWDRSLIREYPLIMPPAVFRDMFGDSVTGNGEEFDHPVRILPSGANPKPGSGVNIAKIPKRFWGSEAKALMEYLEREAPCIFFLDERFPHWDLIPRLSRRIGVVLRVATVAAAEAVVQRAELIGRCNVILATRHELAARITSTNPDVSGRVRTIFVSAGGPEESPFAWRELSRLKVAYTPVLHPPWSDDTLQMTERALAGDGIQFESHDSSQVGDANVYLHLSDSPAGLDRMLDAMRVGCIPIVTRGEAASLIRDGVNGYIVPGGAVGQLAGHLRALRNNPGVYWRLSSAALQSSRSLDLAGEASYSMVVRRVIGEIETGVRGHSDF